MFLLLLQGEVGSCSVHPQVRQQAAAERVRTSLQEEENHLNTVIQTSSAEERVCGPYLSIPAGCLLLHSSSQSLHPDKFLLEKVF